MVTQPKILRGPLRISISVLIIGMLFKIQHWPYANVIIVSAFSSIAILYSFRFGAKKEKKLIDYVKLILVVFWCISGSLKTLHFPFQLFFQMIASIAFLSWITMEGINYFNNETPSENKKNYSSAINIGLFTLAAVFIAIGALFKIMHWPFAGPLLIAGVVLGSVWILKDLVVKK